MTVTDQPREWRDGFLFVGNQLALDFLNTRPLQDGEFTELLPDVAALVGWFRAAGLLSSHEVTGLRRRWENNRNAQRTLQSIREFREKLRDDVIAWEAGGNVRRATLRDLDRLLASHPMRTRIVSGDQLSTKLWFPLELPEDLFAPLAHAAARLFTEADRTRVRKCAHCILHFLDTSKKGTRQWCSMRLCGNRFKVAAYAARQRLVRD